MQLSETVADDRGISARIGKPWTTGGDVSVDRLMWQAVCVVGRKMSGGSSSRSSSSGNKTCLPVNRINSQQKTFFTSNKGKNLYIYLSMVPLKAPVVATKVAPSRLQL